MKKMTEDYVFHYQKRDGHKLVHDVQITFCEEITHFGSANTLTKLADFLRAVGYDFDYIQIVKSHKGMVGGKKDD
jgi:hypothetical protein